MHKQLKVEIRSAADLIMHNGQTANPLNTFAKEMKRISQKRKKTEADFEELSLVEFKAGLYLDENGPCLPATMIDAVVTAGAKKSKNGKLTEAGVFCDQNASLQYVGPRTVAELWADESFRLVVPVKIGQQKVIRTRPIFKNWSATLSLVYETDIINENDVLDAIRKAGMYVGVGDWRPRNGRFALAMDMQQEMKQAA